MSGSCNAINGQWCQLWRMRRCRIQDEAKKSEGASAAYICDLGYYHASKLAFMFLIWQT